ncbi:hypothetical protein AU210_007127 [Fusarium oxysporum f. sp. radicis-cucumerinum]|uniref:Uncharacterized protein n=1 Tax=Fusarium oxysporum f. sp. radicis-cucumerinum TaxID=327505 RepID=A0A2H3HAD3_FUSOX|nr:hypothetical protein AU210_007127 [Fusarium oxysporum f. sp. radicis-cucumerinum]
MEFPPFSCQICHIVFKDDEDLEDHFHQFESLEHSLDEALHKCRQHLPHDDCHPTLTEFTCRSCKHCFETRESLQFHVEDYRIRELVLTVMLTRCRLYHLSPPERHVIWQPLADKVFTQETCDEVVREGNLSRHFRQHFLCYEYCPGCGDIYQWASAFLRHRCPQPSERVEQRKHVLEKMAARELKRVRKTKCPARLKCVQISKRKRNPDAGDGPNQKVSRRNQNGARREQATADNMCISTTSKRNCVEAPQEGSYFTNSINASYDGNELEGSYFTNFTHASYDVNELEGSYFANPLNYPSLLNSSNLATSIYPHYSGGLEEFMAGSGDGMEFLSPKLQ